MYSYNGRNSDGGIFAQSPIGNAIGSPAYCWPSPSTVFGIGRPVPYFVLADDAFPQSISLIKPYGHRTLSRTERIFNYRLSRARRVVENAFGIMASRFRVLRRPLCLKLENVDSVILACCVLHNYLRQHPTARAVYSPTGTADSEDTDSGELRSGSWRAEGDVTCMRGVGQQGSNMSSYSSRDLRDVLHDYVNNAGRVPWQDRMIQ